jgi:phenylacetate-CoA ligase
LVNALFETINRLLLQPLNEWREGTAVLAHLRRLQASQYVRAGQLDDLRMRKLQSLLAHAYESVPFYRRRFREAGLVPADIRSFEDLRRIPPLTKQDMAADLESMVATNIPRSAMHQGMSGGSTGCRAIFYRDNKCLDVKRAAQFRFDSWTGWRVGAKVAYVWPELQEFAPPFTRRQRLRELLVDRTLTIGIGSMHESAMRRQADLLQRYQPTLIRAFPNSLSVLAEYIDHHTVCRIRPMGVLTTGEPLPTGLRGSLQRVFDSPVFDCYGSRECGQTACECESHNGLHINAECLHVEFDNEGAPAQPGQLGHILITDFENYGMPFIRYLIGDMGSPMEGACSCGRTLPRMALGAGRISDFLRSPRDGSLVCGVLVYQYIVEGLDVRQLQVIQDAPDHLTIRINPGRDSTTSPFTRRHIDHVLRRIFHGHMRCTIEQVDSIPYEKSGKYRCSINRLGAFAGIGDNHRQFAEEAN